MTAAGPTRVTSPVPAGAWEAVLRSDPGAVVSQSLAWHAAVLADGRYRDLSALYEFGDGHRIVLPLAGGRRAPGWAARPGSWPGGWGVGGPICEGGRASEAEAEAVLADAAARAGIGVQLQLRHDPGEAWLRAAANLAAGGRRAARFEAYRGGCHVLDLSGGFGAVWQHRFRGTARTAVRKAQRAGLTVETGRGGHLLPVFTELYEKSLRRWAARQHEPLWLSRWRAARVTSARMMETAAERFAENFVIWVARSQGEAVAAIIVLSAQGYAKYWRGAMDAGLAAPLRANDLLHRLAIEHACQAGHRWYDMGATRPGSPLAGFKEKLGAALHYTWTLHAERVPVQRAGRVSRDIAKKLIGFRDI